MEVGMADAPLRETRWAFRLPSRGDEHSVLGLVPVDRGLVHVVPRELVEDEKRCETSELVERRSQWIDVMEDAAGDDCVERPGIVQFLQSDLPVKGTLRSMWIDRERVITGGRQCRCNTTLVTTADLEHPTGRLC